MHAIAISGGGVLGAVALGALSEEHYRNPFDPDIIAGVSSGALIGTDIASADRSCEAFGNKIFGHINLWNGIKSTKDVWRKRWLWPITCIKKCSIGKSGPLFDLIKDRINQEGIKKSGRKLFVGAYDINHRCYLEVNQNKKDLDKWVLASASFPGKLPPVLIDKNKYLDGGVVNQLPSKWLHRIDQKIDKIDLYLCNAITPTTSKKQHKKVCTIFDVLFNSLEGMYDEIFWNDIYPFIFYKMKNPSVNIRVFSLKRKLNIDPLEFNSRIITKLFYLGKTIEPIFLEAFCRKNNL